MNKNKSGHSMALYAGIFFISMSALILQVALTRVFAIMMWYHFTYLIISLALLGFGASGSLLTLLKLDNRTLAYANKLLIITSFLFGATIIISFFSITRIKIDTFVIWKSQKDFFSLIAIFLILSVPFLMGGLAIGSCLTRFSNSASRIYFIDLIGAAAGAIASPFILEKTGQTATIMISAGLAFLSAFAFSIAAIQNNRFKIYGISASIICLIITTGMAIGFSGGSGWIPAMQWKIPFAPNKKVAQFFLVNPVENTIPSAVAQVDISVPIQMRMVMGGEFGILDDENTEARIVSQDGTAPTFLFHDAGNVKKYPQLDDTQAASGYIALKASGIKNPDVMVIGVGGGIDIMIALYQNASSVTAVELNKAMIKMGTETYSDYTGGLFHDSRVNLFNEDGRTHLMRTNKKFDLIQLSGVDTFTALSTGAYTLSESYLYTVEAIQKMYSQLNPEGIINYSRFITEDKPRETLRLANTAFSAMEKLGVKEPWRHIAILQAKDWASTMIKNKPFTANEIIALKEFSDSEGFTGMVFDPTTSNINEITGKTESIKKMREKYFYLLRSSAIDRDFFVNDYIYDIYPATDDKPFFFDYFKISKISIDTMDFTDNFYAEALADFPVGHMILISSLLIVSIFAFLMIVWPLKFLSRHTINRKIRNKTFFYFSSLGIGYMFIEIGMMQKFVLFLGHPIYAMSVVLGGMLTFSGFGSLYSEKFSNINRLTLIKIAAVIIGCTTFNALLLSNTLENLQGASITIRILTTLTLLAPTAFVLGMLFPLGIKLLQKNAAQLIPWGWGINGFMSVLSSILAIMLAMSYGFTWVFWAAGFIYCFGLMQAPLEQKQ